MSFYNETHVKSGRKQKHCMACGTTIEIGKSAWTIPHLDEYSTSTLCEECHTNLIAAGINDSEALFSLDDEEFDEILTSALRKKKIEIILNDWFLIYITIIKKY